MTLTSMTWSKWCVMRVSLFEMYSRMDGVISRWCPVRCRFIGRLRLSIVRLQGFSHVDGENLQRFPVLGNRAPRDHDALLRQDVGNLPVGQGLARILGRYELLDQRAYR